MFTRVKMKPFWSLRWMMTIKELIARLQAIEENLGNDEEVAHLEADSALLEYINDSDVTNAYDQIGKWYA